MSYRALLKRYMQHVSALSGEAWLYPQQDSATLSRRDLVELRELIGEVRCGTQIPDAADIDYNEATRQLCAELQLDAPELAQRLAWPQRVIERWLLEPDHPKFKVMTSRDFQHLQLYVYAPQHAPHQATNSAT